MQSVKCIQFRIKLNAFNNIFAHTHAGELTDTHMYLPYASHGLPRLLPLSFSYILFLKIVYLLEKVALKKHCGAANAYMATSTTICVLRLLLIKAIFKNDQLKRITSKYECASIIQNLHKSEETSVIWVRQHCPIYLITRFMETLQHSASPSPSANRSFNIKPLLVWVRTPLHYYLYIRICTRVFYCVLVYS